MTTMTETGVTTQVYQVFIKATPQAIWDAITTARVDARSTATGPLEYDLRPGGALPPVANDEMRAMGMPEQLVDGEVIEADPPRRLVQTWRFLWDEQIASEGSTRVTWEIDEAAGRHLELTVTHELEDAPTTAAWSPARSPTPAAGGAGSSATSRRCWRPARRCRADAADGRHRGVALYGGASVEPRAIAAATRCAGASGVGLEPTTLRLTVECSA